jgi:hypothetical protein
MKTEEDITQFITETEELMEILRIIQKLHLPQASLCAGTLRNAIWNKLTGQPFKLMSDIDVVYFDASAPYEESTRIQYMLNKTYPMYEWEVKNEVYMHFHNPDTLPYSSVEDAISKFPETPTAIGARLLSKKRIELIAPHGIKDLTQLIVRPTPFTATNPKRLAVYNQRIQKKKWQETWPQLRFKKEIF